MMDRAIAWIAFAALVGFVGVLIGFVPRLDLIAVAAVVLGLAGYDFYRSTRRRPPGRT